LISGDAYVPDSRMTASSVFSTNYGPEKARIDSEGAWYPLTDTVGEWIQVEFDDFMTIQTVTTKGRGVYNQWVTSYELHSSLDGVTWEPYMEPYGDTVKIFSGNVDMDTPVENYLIAPIKAKYVKLYPKSWYVNMTMRFELHGWHYSGDLISGVDRYLADGRLNASSQLDDFHGANRSRLHETASGGMSGGWVPLTMDNQQWIQVDLGYNTAVKGVAMQGQEGTYSFVTEFYVSYSEDLTTWTNYTLPNVNTTMIFEGNLNSSHVRKRYFTGGIIVRAIRLHPTAWNDSIAIRWEVLGCPG
ncbi:hypothetical protein CAPTEDRAFT_105176, partial [Capitella teleta]